MKHFEFLISKDAFFAEYVEAMSFVALALGEAKNRLLTDIPSLSYATLEFFRTLFPIFE